MCKTKSLTLIIVCLASLVFLFLLFAHQAVAAPVSVVTPSGAIGGLESGGVGAYKGIPYAKPPVGELRFAPPQNVVPWAGTLNCENYGAQAVQAPSPTTVANVPMSENCLSLNVWTPATPGSGEKLPVYVFIHGGAYANGSGADPKFDGTNFAKKGIVTVTINYRLNAMGFFASQETLERYGTTGNWGHLDQIKALEWIRDNISSFGGDPDNVTVGGESAGSYSVSMLILSPLAKGLFHGAIMESGSILGVAGNNYYAKGGLKRSIEVSNMLASTFGASDDAVGLAKLRAADANVLAMLSQLDIDFTATPAFFTMPVYDGIVLPKDPVKALRDNNFNRVRLLFGYNRDEGSLFIPDGTSAEACQMIASRMFGYDRAQSVLQRFPIDAQHTSTQRARQLLAYGMFTTGMKTIADAMARSGLGVYGYRFNFVTNAATGLGASHGSELAYTFKNQTAQGHEHDKLADEMHTRWANFMKNGDPNVGDVPPTDVEWPKYDADNPSVIFFDNAVTNGSMPDRDDMEFMESVMYGAIPYYPMDSDNATVASASGGSGGCYAGTAATSAIILLASALFVLRRNKRSIS